MKLLLLLLSALLLSTSCGVKPKPAASLESDNWRYYYDLGMSSFYAKNFSDAISKLYKASLLAPSEPKVWNALGLTYMEVKEYEKADRAFKKALEVDPTFTEAKMNLGILNLKTKNFKEAANYLKEALQDESFDKKHIAYFYLAKIHKELGNTREYLKNLEKATAYNPMFIEAQLELGNAYIELKEYDRAQELYNNLLSNNVELPEIYLNLARIYYEKEHFEDAKAMIKFVLENKMTSNIQRSQAYDLLSKVLIKEQEKLVVSKVPKFEDERLKRPRKTKEVAKGKEQKAQDEKEKPKEEKKAENKEEKKKEEGKYAIQIAAFSSEKRAQKLADNLKNKGLSNIRVLNVRGIYKVVYGSFKDRKEAKRELNRLKKLEIYGFIVEVK